MSEFTYKSTFREWGRIRYLCECSVCGRDCVYNRKIHTKPMCISCQKKRNCELSNNRQKTAYQKGRIDAGKEHEKLCKVCIHKVSKADIDSLQKSAIKDFAKWLIDKKVDNYSDIVDLVAEYLNNCEVN